MPKELFLILAFGYIVLILLSFFMFRAKTDSKLQKIIFLSNLNENNIEQVLREELSKQKKCFENINIFCDKPKSEEAKKILEIFKRKYDFIKNSENHNTSISKNHS